MPAFVLKNIDEDTETNLVVLKQSRPPGSRSGHWPFPTTLASRSRLPPRLQYSVPSESHLIGKSTITAHGTVISLRALMPDSISSADGSNTSVYGLNTRDEIAAEMWGTLPGHELAYCVEEEGSHEVTSLV